MDAKKWNKIIEQLETCGYAVLPDVASSELCKRWIDGYWKTIERVFMGRVRRDDPKTHKDIPNLKGIIQEPCEFSHDWWAWEIRVHMARIFAELYGDPELATSMDRVCYYPSPDPENGVPVRRVKGPWLHTDQAQNKIGLRWIQGFLDLLGTGSLDGGLVVIPKSHLHHQDILDGCSLSAKEKNTDWYKFTEDQLAWLQKQPYYNTPIKVQCPPGSMVLWDSRTLHQNTPPQVGGHQRLVVYVCQIPWKYSSRDVRLVEKTKKRKRECFMDKRVVSHDPIQFHIFPKRARTYGKPVLPYDLSEIRQPSIEGTVSVLIGAKRGSAVPDFIRDVDRKYLKIKN